MAEKKKPANVPDNFIAVQAPKGITVCSVDDTQYEADENGQFWVSPKHAESLIEHVAGAIAAEAKAPEAK